MEIFLEKFLYGYDIHCAFTKILNQSTLGPLIKKCGVDGVVPSFHRHAHNRLCQVQHHPKYKIGAGKEDFKTCERIFSESNALASGTRNSSDFHRHQAIDEYFKFSDVEKYASLGKWHFFSCQCYNHVQLQVLSGHSSRIAALQLNSGCPSLTLVTVTQIIFH